MEHQRFLCPVGQGGFAIEVIGDYTVVYDCGSLTSQQNVEKCIDHLQRERKRVNVLFISHFDKDHVNSIGYLLKRVKVEKAVMSFIPDVLKEAYDRYTNGAYNAIRSLLRSNDVKTEEAGEYEDSPHRVEHHDIWEWIAKSMMTASDFAEVTMEMQAKGINMGRLNDAVYLDGEKENINNAFKSVFGKKGPNAKGLIVLSQKCKDVETKMSIIYQGCEWCHRNTSRMASRVSSCLYVGDADVSNRKNRRSIRDFLAGRTETELMLIQIPHHGSQKNIGARFDMTFPARYYFVNDINTKRFEKNLNLYNALTGQKKLLLVGDNCQELMVTVTEVKE